MVLEHALVTVKPGTGSEFESAMVRARPVIAACPGFISLALHRGVETPDRYLLLVEWETLEDHMVGFRGVGGLRRMAFADRAVLRVAAGRRPLHPGRGGRMTTHGGAMRR